jgi:hypothetical protein
VEPVEAKTFAESEVREVIARHPGLHQTNAGQLEGVIEIHHQHGLVVRQDSFSIEISAHNATSRLPALREVGGRSKAIVLKRGLEDVRAVHQNSVDGTACVCVKQEEAERFPPGALLSTFVEQLAIPYLFGLSYFDEFGKWPWGEYSHGGLGLLEFYAHHSAQHKQELEELLASLQAGSDWPRYYKQLKKPSSKRACICGSGKAFGKCHPGAWRGLKNLISALSQFGFDLKSVQK